MSYILDALRKSEAERKQGEIPDLGSAVQIIHKRRPGGRWLLAGSLVLALLVNAAVLAWLFWPSATEVLASTTREATGGNIASRGGESMQEVPVAVEPQPLSPVSPETQDLERAVSEAGLTELDPASMTQEAQTLSETAAARTEPASPETSSAEPLPGPDQAGPDSSQALSQPIAGDHEAVAGSGSRSVPALEATAADFQRRIPDLRFNSHIFSSSPASRRVMINDEYLREGASFSGMVVDEITEDGVILQLQGERFSVSVVRDWIAPR